MSLETLPYLAILFLYFPILIASAVGGVWLIMKSKKVWWKIALGILLILIALLMLPFVRIMGIFLYLTVTGQGFGA